MPSWLPLLLILACPLMMIFMMRGMSGAHDNRPASTPSDGSTVDPAKGSAAETNSRDARLAELEQEVARLRASQSRRSESDPPTLGGVEPRREEVR